MWFSPAAVYIDRNSSVDPDNKREKKENRGPPFAESMGTFHETKLFTTSLNATTTSFSNFQRSISPTFNFCVVHPSVTEFQ